MKTYKEIKQERLSKLQLRSANCENFRRNIIDKLMPYCRLYYDHNKTLDKLSINQLYHY